MVRSEAADLALVENLLDALNQSRAQITIEARFIEVAETDADSLGLNARRAIQDRSPQPKSKESDASSNLLRVLDEAESRKMLELLKNLPGAEILATPNVTTLTGRQAQISTLDTVTVVTGLVSIVKSDGTKEHLYQTSPMTFGPVLEVTPFVTADNQNIHLDVMATVTTLLGYDKPPAEIDGIQLQKMGITATLPLPRVQKRQLSGSTVIRDGQTLVLSTAPGVSAVHQKDRDLVQKRLLVFVTATLIDPAGNRIHPGE